MQYTQVANNLYYLGSIPGCTSMGSFSKVPVEFYPESFKNIFIDGDSIGKSILDFLIKLGNNTALEHSFLFISPENQHLFGIKAILEQLPNKDLFLVLYYAKEAAHISHAIATLKKEKLKCKHLAKLIQANKNTTKDFIAMLRKCGFIISSFPGSKGGYTITHISHPSYANTISWNTHWRSSMGMTPVLSTLL